MKFKKERKPKELKNNKSASPQSKRGSQGSDYRRPQAAGTFRSGASSKVKEKADAAQRDQRPGPNNKSPLGPQTKRDEDAEQMPKSSEVICGKNSVLEALRSSRQINQVLLAEGLEPAFANQVIELCRAKAVPYKFAGRNQLEKTAGPDNRGVVAEVAAASYVEISEMLAAARAEGQAPLLVILDGVEDPHNLGAVIRTALCAGAHGLIIPKRNAVSLNQTVSKVSAGAIEHLPVARVSNLVQTVEELKKEGLWVVAADMDGQRLWDVDMSGPLVIVLGGEGRGISPLLRSHCDFVASIPLMGAVSSLNVSAAAAVMLYEALRRRQ